MSPAIAAMLMALGCAPASFSGPAGEFFIWVCPPVAEQAEPDAPPAPPAPAPQAPRRAAPQAVPGAPEQDA